MKTAKENSFQAKLITDIKNTFPGCIVLKNDPNYIQGFPDLTILYNNKWAVLESKREPNSSRRPNQPYYIKRCNEMSFAMFVDSVNKKEVINKLKIHFGYRKEDSNEI